MMRKVLKIGGIILGVILIVAIVIFAFFPGIFDYIKVKREYKDIDRTIGEFETEYIPNTFKAFTINGLKLKAPDDYYQKEKTALGTSNSLRSSDGDVSILIMKSDSAETAETLKKYAEEFENNPDYDEWEYYDYEAADYKSFFRTIGEKYPTAYDASSEIMWFIKDKFNAKMCLKLRSMDRKVFLEFAEIKEGMWSTENAWKMNGDGFTAYISENISDMYSSTTFWTIKLYPDGGGSEYYFSIIKGADEETTKQIISSLKLAD